MLSQTMVNWLTLESQGTIPVCWGSIGCTESGTSRTTLSAAVQSPCSEGPTPSPCDSMSPPPTFLHSSPLCTPEKSHENRKIRVGKRIYPFLSANSLRPARKLATKRVFIFVVFCCFFVSHRNFFLKAIKHIQGSPCMKQCFVLSLSMNV